MDIAFSSYFKAFLPAGIIALSLLSGYLLQRLVTKKLRKMNKRTIAPWDEVLIRSLKGVVFVWFLLLGLSVALKFIVMAGEIYPILQKLLIIAAILSVILFLARAGAGLITLSMSKISGVPTTIFKNVIVIIVSLVGFLVILDELGIPIAPIITALGIGGLAIALALQDTLANLFSGLYILMSRNIRLGDYVKLSTGEDGYVVDITWRNTTLLELENNIIIIPNKKLADGILTNYSLPDKETAVLVDVKVGYGTDLKTAESLIVEVGKDVLGTVPGGIPNYEPLVRFNVLGDYNIKCTVVLRTREYVSRYLLKHEFIKKLRDRFQAEGLEEPFPVGTVHLEKDE